MEKGTCIFAPSVSLALLCCYVQGGFAQNPPTAPELLPLTVQVGTPLQIALTKKVPVKHAGVPVEGKVVENVYVFDHLVIPAGSRVMGQVTKVESAPRKQRALAIANGNFTPLRQAPVDFNDPGGGRWETHPLADDRVAGCAQHGSYGCGRKRKEEKRTRGEQGGTGSSAGLESRRGRDQQCDRAGQGAAAEGGTVGKIALPSAVFAGGHKLHRRTQNAFDLWYGKLPPPSSWRKWEGPYHLEASSTSA